MPSISLAVSLRGQLLSGTRAFSPSALFALAEPGVWYDPSDTSTLFQDTAGTTPVTTPGQAVALMLDKSRGLTLGAELVANGDFSAGSTGWTGGTVSGGQINVPLFNEATQAISLTAGRTYRVSFDINASAGMGRVTVGATLIDLLSVSRVGAVYYIVTTNTTALKVGCISGTSVSFDNISVRELPGNHATQGTIASRPIYGVVPQGGRRNLLLATDNFVTSLPGTVATSNNQSPTGALNAYGFTENTDNIQRSAAGFNTATGQTRSFFVRRTAGTSTRYLAILATNVAAGGAFFNLATGTVTTNNPANFTATIQLVGDFWRCSITRVDAVNSDLMLCITSQNAVYSGSQAYAGDGVSKFVIWGAQLEAGSLTNYQSVTTQYDVTEAGVPSCSYLFFDGGSDSMATGNIDFTATDKMTVFAGVRKNSDAAAAVLAELSTSVANNGSILLAAPVSNSANYHFASRGTSAGQGNASYTNASIAAPNSSVLTGIGDIAADGALLRVNGVQRAQDATDQGTGTYGNYPLYIGARAGTSLFFNGNLFGLVVRGAASTATQITATEAWLAPKSTFFKPVITGVPTVGVS